MPDVFPVVPMAAATAAVVSALTIGLMLRTGFASIALDRPNDRSMHTRPTPRIGGLGILAGFVAAAVAWGTDLPSGVWIGLLIVCAVSVIDDLRGLPAAVRLPLHLAAAAVAVAGNVDAPFWIASAVVLAMGWMTNLYNFMDGSNGLAGGQAVFGFGALSAGAIAAGDASLAVAAACAAGGAIGFLPFNFPTGRIFMGDAGSTALGFLAAAFGVLGVARGLWSPAFAVIAFLPFVFDASATLAVRALRGRRVWEAHREHAYQRLNMAGLGHRRTGLLYWALMLGCAAVAVACRESGAIALAALAALFGILYIAAQRAWHRRNVHAASGVGGKS